MSRHSKNNTAAPYLSSVERQKLRGEYGSATVRLSKESFKSFDACYLCLQRAISPLSCLEGHLACKKCLLENMLLQKELLKKKQHLKDEMDRLKSDRKYEDSMKVQGTEMALFLTANELKDDDKIFHTSKKIKSETESAPLLLLSYDNVSEQRTKLKDVPHCQGSKNLHPLCLKKLVPVYFSVLSDKKDSIPPPTSGDTLKSSSLYYCPCCRKALQNATKLAFSRHCGHVLCTDCILLDSKHVDSQNCLVCSKTFNRELDLIFLQSTEGTGYAGAGGNVTVKRDAIAFN